MPVRDAFSVRHGPATTTGRWPAADPGGGPPAGPGGSDGLAWTRGEGPVPDRLGDLGLW